MKAKEYAKKFDACHTQAEVMGIFSDFLHESFDLIRQTGREDLSILLEINDKWKAICRLTDIVNPKGYESYLKQFANIDLEKEQTERTHQIIFERRFSQWKSSNH